MQDNERRLCKKILEFKKQVVLLQVKNKILTFGK